MHIHYKYGAYLPSYIYFTIDTYDPIANIKELDGSAKQTFIHEYTHFLQNLSSGFGLSHIWNTYDRSRQTISFLQKQLPTTQFAFPLKGPVTDEQLRFFKIRQAIEGKYRVTETDDVSARIIAIEFYKDTNYANQYPHANTEFIRLILEDKNGDKEVYNFGESAVSECMAYLMEMKFFNPSPLNQFPYSACQLVGEFIDSEITKNEEWLFALCDVALLSSFPGTLFYQILKEMKDQNFIPGDAKDIYEFGISHMYMLGWNIWEDFKANAEGCIYVLNNLFSHQYYEATLNWFTFLIKEGYNLRIENRHFFLDLYREGACLEGFWETIYIRFGTPQINNLEGNRFFQPPHHLSAIAEKIDPIFLVALQQINNLILQGYPKRACKLKEYCSKNKNGLITDNRCDETPWLRSADTLNCAYGSLWAIYDFNQIEIKL